jgi:flagellar hook-associated protein 2
MMGELRDILSSTVSGGSYSSLNDVGISSSPGVGLVLDSTKFNAAMNSNLTDLSNLFTSSGGYATKLDAWAKSSLNVTVNTRTSNISKNITDIANQVAIQETRMTSLQKRYTAQFTNLNTVLAQLSNVSSSITNGIK